MSEITGSEWNSGNNHIVMGGGGSLKGAPESWEWARNWADRANEASDSGVEWSWDCHFKLDYDGGIARISSRFYPPAKFYGPGWDGTVSLMVGEKTLLKKKFEAEDLDNLKVAVENYVHRLTGKIESLLSEIKEL